MHCSATTTNTLYDAVLLVHLYPHGGPHYHLSTYMLSFLVCFFFKGPFILVHPDPDDVESGSNEGTLLRIYLHGGKREEKERGAQRHAEDPLEK